MLWAVFKKYLLTIGGAALCAVLVREFVVESYRIPNAAMTPGLSEGQTVLAWKFPFVWGEKAPELLRGEVIVYSNQEALPTEYVRRVVGLPGDRVAIQSARVVVNGQTAFRELLPGVLHGHQAFAGASLHCFEEAVENGKSYPVCSVDPFVVDLPEQKVPEGHVMVLSDLRQPFDKKKEKSATFVPLTAIRGKVMFAFLPRGQASGGGFSILRILKRIQ
jgi:signal peptidase I